MYEDDWLEMAYEDRTYLPDDEFDGDHLLNPWWENEEEDEDDD